MKKFLVISISFLLSFSPMQATYAIEDGIDSTGNTFTVPITVEKSAGKYGGCSGVLIAPSIVATAGHCVLDSTGLLTTNVFVGDPGATWNSINPTDKIFSVQITPGFQNAANDRVGDDDIVFLILAEKKTFDKRVRLASEVEVQNIRSKAGPLKVFGYGSVNDAGDAATTPRSTEGTFSSTNPKPNMGILEPIKKNVCQGDSGGPVVSITATEIVVIGVIVGADLRNACGKTFGSFTLVSRYTNLAFSAAISQMNNLEAELAKVVSEASEFSSSQYIVIDELNARISELEAEIERLKLLIPSTITCVKGKLTKKVTTVNPKCPSGYKQK
jgi:secreted trypsin-like serine protease